MELYFYICGVFAILSLFGVFDSFEKSCGLNRWFVSVFFILSMIFNFLPSVSFLSFCINWNLFLYIFAVICFVIKKNTARGIASVFILCLITIAVLICCNTTNLGAEFAFIKPYFYVAIGCGLLSYFLCTNFYNMFVGTFLGAGIYEIVMHNFFVNFDEYFVFASQDTLTYIIVCSITYALVFGVVNLLRSIKIKKMQKNENLTN